MSLAHLNWFSETLLKMVGTNVLLPDAGLGPFPVFYLLHGLSDDYTAWIRRTSIERYISGVPLIVVMADGGRGFYTDNADGPAYGRFFAEELPACIERIFPARTDRAGRCIGGLSMGGYGALRLALTHPDRYVSANSHSGALLAWRHDPSFTSLAAAEHQRIFGPRANGSAHDLIVLAEKASSGLRPKLRIDCGTEDFLLPANRAYRDTLRKLGIAHEYEEYPGTHEWGYWDLHVREAIHFHARALGLVKPD